MSVVLGAIADDFTGATDLANTLVKQGMRVTLVIGVPDDDADIGDAQAVIVALKSRTCPVDDAVAQSLAALYRLRNLRARQILFKYCSTFDSTANGNIGPVADALMDALACDFAFVCPAFPENGRTVYQGHLFVGETLLSESPMKDHPLTPMRDANLVRLMGAQSSRRVGLISYDRVRLGAAEIERQVKLLKSTGISYGVVDTLSEQDLKSIGQVAAGHALVTGGSAVALALPNNFRELGLLNAPEKPLVPDVTGRAVVLAGSCSQATRRQINHVSHLWPCRKIDVDAIAAGKDVAGDIGTWANAQSSKTPILIYASSDPQEVKDIQDRYGKVRAGDMVEGVFGNIAIRLVENGARLIVVAGGETSGAVVSALEIKALCVGPEIDPGVPWTKSLSEARVALALKSGNFGSPEFFAKAFEMLS